MRALDQNEDEQKRTQGEQIGSEVRSVDLERLIAEGVTMIERRIAMEVFLDDVPDLFKAHIGTAWKPRTRSRANHRNFTASVIREFIVAKCRAEIEPLIPKRAKNDFAGGVDFNNDGAIWDALDRVFAKHADMFLMDGDSSKGAEFVASRWADARNVT